MGITFFLFLPLKKTTNISDVLKCFGTSHLPSFTSIMITLPCKIFSRTTRPKDLRFVPSEAPGSRCSQCDRVIFYRHYHPHQSFYGSLLSKTINFGALSKQNTTEEVSHVSDCKFPSGAVSTIHLECDKNKAKRSVRFHTHTRANTYTHKYTHTRTHTWHSQTQTQKNRTLIA